MKIRKLHLKNIGVFDDEEIEFKECPAKDKAEIHILTGENGTGKTTILLTLSEIFGFYRNDIPFENVLFLKVVNLEFHKRNKIGSHYNFRFQGKIGQSNQDINKEFDNYRNGRTEKFSFAVFSYSGYRKITNETIEVAKNIEEHPLKEALHFNKNADSRFNVNQWLGQNLLNSSLAHTKQKANEAKVFDEKIKQFEQVINDIIADETKNNEIRFEMQSATKLVLIKNEQELDFDVLPDGLKSLISWIGDLLMRLDSLKWKDDTPIFDREIILFLDEIEVHLHPAWQRKVLPVVQKLFKNAQIFVSTHSPFVVNSVDDAWVYKLKVKDGKAKVESVERSEDARSYRYVLRNTFDIENEFGIEIENRLKDFFKERDSYLQGNGNSKKAKIELKKIADELSKQSKELKSKIDFELFQLSEITGEDF